MLSKRKNLREKNNVKLFTTHKELYVRVSLYTTVANTTDIQLPPPQIASI